MLGPGDGDIHPSLVTQEADLSVRVVPHAVEDHDIPLLTLECIHCVDVIFECGKQLSQELHLSLVRSDDSNAALQIHARLKS